MILERAVITSFRPGGVFRDGDGAGAHRHLGRARFRSLRILRGVERRRDYLLLVEWDTLETQRGFRQSQLFHQWRGLIGRYFDGEPNIEHFEPVEALEAVAS